MTSSKINRAPFALVSSRSASRNPGSGAMTPTFAPTGSTMIAAIRSGWVRNAAATASGSLYGTTTVSDAAPAVTPAEPGMAKVARPDPASTSRLSPWPW